MVKGSAGVEREDEVNGPLVFQCRECRNIVGDSFAFVSALQDLDAIVLSCKSILQSLLFRLNSPPCLPVSLSRFPFVGNISHRYIFKAH